MQCKEAELFLKKYWWRPENLGGGGRGRPCLTLHCHHHNESALRWAVLRAILMFHYWGWVDGGMINTAVEKQKL